MNATEVTVGLFKGLGLTVLGVFVSMGGLALVLFQQQWAGLVPLVAGSYLVARARPSIVRATERNPYEDPLVLGVPERSLCARCRAPSIDKWRTFCVVCEWQPGDPPDAPGAGKDLVGTTRKEQHLRARLLRLYERVADAPDDSREVVWQEIVQAEENLSAAYAERTRKSAG